MPTNPDPNYTMTEAEAFAILGQFPHCDSRVLHRPKECEYCDDHPEWQALRILYGINFTGENDPLKSPCPAEARRAAATINKWGGNVPRPKDEPEDRFARMLKDEPEQE